MANGTLPRLVLDLVFVNTHVLTELVLVPQQEHTVLAVHLAAFSICNNKAATHADTEIIYTAAEITYTAVEIYTAAELTNTVTEIVYTADELT